jgi:putative oxidoreductase
MSYLQKYGRLVASALLALIVGAAGIAKLMGVPMVHQSFAILGLPSWFGYFIGACEVAGAVGLFIPALSRLAATGLAIIGAGAVYFHIMHTPISQGVPAIIVLVLAAALAVKQRSVTA